MSNYQPLLESIGYEIKRLRKINKWTQTKLASKAGLSRLGIGEIERSRYNLRLTTLLKISKALNVSPCYILEKVNSDEEKE